MAVLADGRTGADGRAEPSLRALRAGKAPLCDRSLRQRDESALRGNGSAAGGPVVPRGRIFDRGHGGLSMDRSLGTPGPEARRLSESKALVARHARTAGCEEGV